MSKKSFYGIGYNSKGKYKATISGTPTLAYKTWCNMIMRCYCADTRKRQPTYAGCSVDGRWLDFQDFADWFYNHKYSDTGYQLDKDLLIPGNKIYAPDRCVFVPRQLNSLLLDCGVARGQYRQGVSFHKRNNKFTASIRINGKGKGLGYFDNELDAYNAYKEAKERHVKNTALEWRDRIAGDVFDALMQWSLDSK